MPTQIPYNDRLTNDVDLTMPRGESREYTFSHVLGAESAVKEARFMVRTDDTAETVIISYAWDTHPTQFDFSVDDECTVYFLAADTVGETLDTYKFALELVDQNDLVYTPWRGKFTISDDIVNDDETAAHLSYTVRSALTAEITIYESQVIDMASAADFSWLTAAASLGTDTLVVANGAIYAATDSIRIMLDDGTYDDDTIASVTDETITLDGTLTSDAAAYNMVRLLV